MSIIDFKKLKEDHKEKNIKLAYSEAIDIFGEEKFRSNITIDLTSKSLKSFLESVYNLYMEKGIIKYYQSDIKVYINDTINKVRYKKEKVVTKTSLLDSLVCDLYTRRVEESKEKSEATIKRNENNGRKYNQKLWTYKW